MYVATTEAGSVTEGVDPNELPAGSAPEDPVQLPDFTVIDSTGSDFSLDKLQVLIKLPMSLLVLFTLLEPRQTSRHF